MAAISTLSGNFTSAVDWSQSRTDVTITNPSNTQITMGTTGTSLIIGGSSGFTWDLTNSSWSARFISMPTAGTSHGMELRTATAGNLVRLWRSAETGGGEWSFSRTIASTRVDATGVVTQTHLTSNPYVRIREASGTLFFDTSADGTTWNNQLSVATSTLAITVLQPRFQISTAVTGNWVIQQVNGAVSGTVTTASASAIDSAGVWVNSGNVFSSNDVYATDIGTVQNTEYPMDIGGFDSALSAITAGSTIIATKVTIEGKTGTAARAQIKGEMFDGATAITPTLALTNLTAADVNYTFNPTATLAQLQSAAMFVRVTNKRIVAQASTTSVDYVKVEVEWTAGASAPARFKPVSSYHQHAVTRAGSY